MPGGLPARLHLRGLLFVKIACEARSSLVPVFFNWQRIEACPRVLDNPPRYSSLGFGRVPQAINSVVPRSSALVTPGLAQQLRRSLNRIAFADGPRSNMTPGRLIARCVSPHPVQPNAIPLCSLWPTRGHSNATVLAEFCTALKGDGDANAPRSPPFGRVPARDWMRDRVARGR
jgi:hypothetical protein